MTVHADEFRARLETALTLHDLSRPRSQQRQLGFSDLVCREKARRKLVGAPISDDPPRWIAQVGSALHALWAEALPYGFDGLVIERELQLKLPSGIMLTGHPDIIDPAEPSCTDGKSVNGPGELARVARHGPDEAQIMQVSLGFEAARQAGIITSETGVVRLFWRDRSGKSDATVVWQEPFDPHWVEMADTFYDDAAYAAEHDEQAMQDPHWSWCQRCCEFFTDCRGGKTVFGPKILDQRLARAARDHFEAKRLRDHYADEVDAARDVLEELKPASWGDDIPTYQVDGLRVRWSWIHREDLEEGGYARLEVDEVEE